MRQRWKEPTTFCAMLSVTLWIGLLPGISIAQRFTDQTAQLAPGLPNAHAAWGDYNNDGYADIVTRQQVWRNNAGTSFTLVATLGADTLARSVWGDYDKDGYLDTATGANGLVLFRNNAGTGSFTQVGLPPLPMTRTNASAWGDFDRDGDIDLYVGGYETTPGDGQQDAILRNNLGSFTKIWNEKNGQARSGRGITTCDFDHDGDLDIYVSNFRQHQNYLWRNNGSGVFTDVLAAYGMDVASPVTVPAGTNDGQTSGSTWGDLDNDGYFDLLEGNYSTRRNNVTFVYVQKPLAFYRNLGPSGSFHFEFKDTCGVSWQETYLSPALGDYDSDGDLDLYYTTIFNPAWDNFPNYPRLYRNNGNWNFTDVTTQEGLSGLPPTYQAAWADFDHDGDLDLVSAGKIFVNGGVVNKWLEVTLLGAVTGDNVIGSQVRTINGSGGYTGFTRQVEAGTGEAAQNDMTLHFGFGAGALTSVDLEVRWPDGTTSTALNIGVNNHIVIRKGQPGWSNGWQPNPPPAAITTLAAGIAGCSNIRVRWTATGADGNVGTASAFDLRRSTAPITEANFASAIPVPAPAPGPSGTLHDINAGGLPECTTLFFAIKARDAAGNWSPISNVPSRGTQCCGGNPCAGPPPGELSPRRPDTQGARFCGTEVRGTPVPAPEFGVIKRLIEEKRVAAGGVIPVNFHVIYSGLEGNVPESQLDAQITVLNYAFAGKDYNGNTISGAANTGYTFFRNSVTRTDCEVWFHMAHSLSVPSDEEIQAKSALVVNPTGSLNFYTCLPPGSSDAAWATFPEYLATQPILDGVVVEYTSLPGGPPGPRNLGGSGVHETGHWMGLLHTFEGFNCSSAGDLVEDTPPVGSPTIGCPPSQPSCDVAIQAPFHNYMDYSDDICYNNFTPGQDARADVMMSQYRNSIVNPAAGPVIQSTPSGGVALRIAPNPSTARASIEFRLGRESHATLRVYDVQGRRVESLVERSLPAGEHRFDFGGKGLSSGIYLVVLDAEGQRIVRRMTLVK